jgi:mRNA-degrading endonuclease RelE of RelBE toxin-antitoxin system
MTGITGGCRSLWPSNPRRATSFGGAAVRGRGKSGGIRVIYYLVDEGEIYFLFAYAKNEQEDLDSRQLRVLRNLVKEEFE